MVSGTNYFFTVKVTDHGGPAKSTQGKIRLDVFDPELYVVQIEIKMNLDEFWKNEEDFTTKTEELLRKDYPDLRLFVWKATAMQPESSKTRRRLLQT